MIIDIHTHVFPSRVRQTRQHFFMDEPAFKLLYASPKSRLAGASETVAMMDDQGVDKSVIFGFPWHSADTFKRNNDYVLDAVARYPHRLIGFCCLDPTHRDAPAEVERCLQAGLSGVGELAFYTSDMDGGCLECLDPIMALAKSHHCPVMVHTNEPVGHSYPGKSPNTLAQISALVRRFNQNRIILAHWGGGLFFYALLKKQMREELANVWFDTAASPYLYRPDIYRLALSIAGEDKILLGTDFPLLEPQRYFKEMAQAGLTAEQHNAVCGSNAARLLGLWPVGPLVD
jgi:predicted TIM-barrel fold metal-dependent hydrolase